MSFLIQFVFLYALRALMWLFFQMGHPGLFFVYFRSFQTEIPKVRNRSPGSSSLLPSKRSDQTSVTRLGEFRKFLETNFGSKVAQMYSNFLGYFKEHPFQGKLLLLLFGQLLETFGLPFISTSDRTGFNLPMSRCYKQSTIVIYKSSHYLVRVA